jgi:hypothetical protein
MKLLHWKKSPKKFGLLLSFSQKLPKENNRTMGENTPQSGHPACSSSLEKTRFFLSAFPWSQLLCFLVISTVSESTRGIFNLIAATFVCIH